MILAHQEIYRKIYLESYDKDVIPCVHFTGSTDFHTLNILVNNLIRRYEDEHNKGKSGTGNGDLSKNDREVSNGPEYVNPIASEKQARVTLARLQKEYYTSYRID